MFNDAATFDIATGTGGMNGSVVLSSEERKRAESAGLEELIGRLTKAKEAIDSAAAKRTAGPISWADLIVCAARVAVKAEWLDVKV